MKNKDRLSIKILISIFISLMLILLCFYRYSKAINNDYIKRTKEEASSHSYLNSQLFASRIKNTVDELNIITNTYFKNKELINEEVKKSFNISNNGGFKHINIYTQEDINFFYREDNSTIRSIEDEKNILYLYKPDKDASGIEIILPIYNYKGNIIGGISTFINQEEFNILHNENNKYFKFSTYIFDYTGQIIFGGHLFGKSNIYEIYDEINVDKNINSKDILSSNLKTKKSFEIYFIKEQKGYYAFFNPAKDDFYALEIMPIEYVEEYTKENSRIFSVVLIQVMIIICLQTSFLFLIIILQNKKLIKTEVSKNRELDTIINSVPGGVTKILGNKDLKLLFANEGFYELTGYDKNEYIEKFDNRHIDIIDENDRNIVLNKIENLKETKNKITIEYKIIKKDGTKSFVSLTGEYLEDFYNIPIYQCIVTDMTEYKKILNDLQLEKEQYDIIYKMSDEIIFEYYVKEDRINISDRYKENFNIYFQEENFLKNIIKNHTIYKKDIKNFIKNIKDINNTGFIENEIRIKNNDRNYNWTLYQGFSVNDSEGNIYKVIGKISNIDKFKKEIEELKEKSSRDPLTKLYNKVTIENIVNKTILDFPNETHAIFIIDVDNFKSINDTFGHIFGDAVLKNIANNVCQICTKNDILARIGGDEFVLFLKNVEDISYIENMAKNICNIFRKTYDIQNREHKISASVGIAIYPKYGNTYTELLEKADIAVYNSKNEGKDQYKIYNSSMQHTSLLSTRETSNKQDEIRNINRSTVYENVLINISEMFLQVKDMEATINIILSTLCKNFKISRAYIFEGSYDGNFISNTYEWCNENLKLLIDKYQNISFNEKEFLKCYNEKPFLYYNSKKDIEDNKYILNYIYDKDNIDNINLYFSCYFMEQGKVKGYIGFESYDEDYVWSSDEIEGAFLISRLIGTQILKYKSDKKFNTEMQINNAIVNNQLLYTYIIQKDTFELLYFNDKINKILPNAKVGEICYMLKGYNKPCDYCPIRTTIEHLDNNSTKYFCDISDMWLGATSSKINWIDGTDAYIICARDISEYIDKINYTDTLTGIPSLTKFKIQANNILNNIKGSNNKYALFYMDIDKFKYINDTFGYVRGDDVLKTFAMVLYESVRDDEIFCRANDDRFLAIIKYETEEDLKQRLINGNRKIEKMQKLFFSDMKLTIICGIYNIRQNEKDLNSIIDKANIARKTIKGSHKNSFAIYNKEINEQTVKEKMIEGRMEYALKHEEFLVYLQPKFDLLSNKVCGAEALVRWKQKNGKMIYPDDFIPIFEKNGFIVNIDLYIYEKIFKKVKEWIDKGIEVVPISLNVSRAHTKNLDFIKKVLNLVDIYNIPVNTIEFELTESIFSTDLNYLNDFIQKIRKNGFKVSIDDFGSAYSSLNLLKEIEVDIIKLDKAFLSNVEDFKNSYKDKVIIESIIKMAKELNLKVVCEGIETEEQKELLKNMGCEVGQGYIFSKPISIYEFEEKFYK